jgi:phospholipid/cholesterol/gamma-HCH transport system substrate-binding protein
MRGIRRRIKDIVAIVGLVAVATVVGGYILENQRLRFPLIEDKPFQLKAEFETAQAVTPGQGQTVRVAGVRIGDIAKTQLRDGRAVITMDIDKEFSKLIRTDARALLRPKTGLKDMFIEVDPGSKDAPVAREGWTMPIGSTLPDVNPDEILAGLDQDTRDYLRLLLQGASQGLEGRGEDLRTVLKRFEPTHRDLARINREVAQRRRELRRLVTSLNRLNTEVGREDDTLAQLVQNASRSFGALAAERENVAATVRELPSTLRTGTATLQQVERTARAIPPASEALQPTFRALRRANEATRPFAEEAAPRIREDIRPFVRAARPLVRELRQPAADVAAAAPDLTRTFRVLNRFFNMLAHNPRGKEGPAVQGRDEGYLFWLAWVAHQTNNLFSTADAHGPGRAISIGGTCGALRATAQRDDLFEAIFGLSGAFVQQNVCGEGAGG